MSWIPGSDSGSQTLTEDDHLWETHTNELRVAVNASMREVFNVKGAYGAVGDGTTIDRHSPDQIGSSTWKSVAPGGGGHVLGGIE